MCTLKCFHKPMRDAFNLGFDRDGKLRAICGGGRYDRLLSIYKGDDIPACGFGFGDVVEELLKEKGYLPELTPEVDNIVYSLDQELQGAASSVAARLGELGQGVDLVLETKPLKWYMILPSKFLPYYKQHLQPSLHVPRPLSCKFTSLLLSPYYHSSFSFPKKL